MTDSIFRVGDVVQLKSGGPHMTIQHVDSAKDTAECLWFPMLSASRIERFTFPMGVLVKIANKSPAMRQGEHYDPTRLTGNR